MLTHSRPYSAVIEGDFIKDGNIQGRVLSISESHWDGRIPTTVLHISMRLSNGRLHKIIRYHDTFTTVIESFND